MSVATDPNRTDLLSNTIKPKSLLTPFRPV